jgi:dTDP-4-amino-4,6-dideoxygalactose transaminase
MNLAIRTGHPRFRNAVHVGRPNIGDRKLLLQLVEGMLDRLWLSNGGPLVEEFEARISKYIGARHCVCMCNATIALEIAIRAAGFEGEVIVPAFTFIATAHALQWQGIRPVFCDIDPATHCLDPAAIESLITPRTTGIIAVHLWGQPCNVEEIEKVARRYGLPVIYDAAHAFACSHHTKMVGSFGRAEVFSFHATKFFNAFEGGAVVTNDDSLADAMRLMRNFGFAGYDNVVCVGTNGKMTEVSAAMGLTSFAALSEFIETNRRNYQAYLHCLRSVPGVRLLNYDEAEKRNYQYIVLEIDESVAGLNRDDLIEVLRAENVLARRYFWPGCHRMEPYKTLFPKAGSTLTVSEKIADRVLVLPTGTAVNARDVQTICMIILEALAHPGPVRQSLESNALTARI